MHSQSETTAPGARAGFLERHHYLLRRLHSLSGIVPIGLFLIVHLTTNSSIIWGAINAEHGDTRLERGVGTFQHEVYFIHSLPALILIEIFGLWLPIAFHAILGVYYARSGVSNTDRYKYQANRRYTWQRITGYIGIVFIFYHVATLRWHWTFLVPEGVEWSYAYAASTLAHALQGSTRGMTVLGFFIAALYFVGVTAMVYHFANGLWTAAITWGLTISIRAQQRWGYICAAIGLGLLGMGWSAVIGFASLDVEQARRVEEAMMPNHVRDSVERTGSLEAQDSSGASAADQTKR